MKKTYTISQFRIMEFVESNLAPAHFAFDPISRDSIRILDYRGHSICLTYDGNAVVEIPQPQPISNAEVKAFLHAVKPADIAKISTPPCLEHIMEWWAGTPNPLTLRQVLGFPEQLYLYFLTRPIPDFAWVQNIVKKQFLTPEDKCGIDLWYFNGGLREYVYGCVGNQGTRERWEIRRMHTAMDDPCLSFCLLDPALGDCPPFDPLAILKEGRAV